MTRPPVGSLRNERLPLQPLLDALTEHKLTVSQASLKAGCNLYKTLNRPDGTICVPTGDRIAVRALGVHPTEIWGDTWWTPTTTKGAA